MESRGTALKRKLTAAGVDDDVDVDAGADVGVDADAGVGADLYADSIELTATTVNSLVTDYQQFHFADD